MSDGAAAGPGAEAGSGAEAGPGAADGAADDLVARVGAPPRLAAALRGARDLAEARDYAVSILDPWGEGAPPPPPADAAPTLLRFAELRAGLPDELDDAAAREVVRELQAVRADLRALRRALTGRERGPELWAVVRALLRDEALARAGFAAAQD